MGPSPKWRTAGPRSACWSRGPAAARTDRALSGSSPGRLRARRRRAKRAKSAARTASLTRPAVNCLTRPAPAGQDVQSTVDVDDLDQLGGTEAVKQVRRAERGLAWMRGPGTAANWRVPLFEPLLFSLKRRARLTLLCASSSFLVTVRSAARLALSSASARGRTAGMARAGARQRSLQVSKSRGRPAVRRGVARGRPVRRHARGLRSELGGTKGEPVLVQDIQSATAGGQHPARTVLGLGA